MKKPSIFSSSYREQVRRRRLNITLIILILISAAYFGGQYYIDKHDIKVLENFKISSLLQFNKKDSETKDVPKDNKNVEPPSNPGTGGQPQTPPPTKEEKKTVHYDYTTSNSRTLRVELEVTGGTKIIKGLAENTGNYFYNISSDKQMIVFEDKLSQDIVICDINGNFKEIGPREYVSKSSGETIDKGYTLKNRTWHVWSQRPHFTMDGRVAYISNLPYVKLNGDFYLWTVNIDGSGHRKIGVLKGNMDNISYDGFTEDGKLRIKAGDNLYFLGQNSYALGR